MQVFLHHIVEKYIDRLNASDRNRINEAIKDLKKEPPEGDIEPMSGQPGRFRVRVGGYRFLFRIKNNAILVTHIDPRGQVYNKKNKGDRR